MQRAYTIEEIKAIVDPIARAYGVERVYLFGSYARGEARPDSDIDLRIDGGAIKGYFKLGGFYQDIADQLAVHLDLLTTDALNPKFLSRIKGEEVSLYEQ